MAPEVPRRRFQPLKFEAHTVTPEAEFFWLGRIPCRSVKLVGLLVGVQAYEQRVIYHCECYLLYLVQT